MPDSELEHEIALLERHGLVMQFPPLLKIEEILDGHEWVRVTALAKFWENDLVNFVKHIEDLVVGAHSYEGYLSFIITGTASQIELFFAIADPSTVTTLLKGAFPGISIHPGPVTALEKKLASRFVHHGMVSGIPSARRLEEEKGERWGSESFPLERLIRAMRDTSWMYVVQAYPRPPLEMAREREELLDQIARYASLTRQQLQRSAQSSTSRTNRETETISEVLGGELINRRAEYLVERLERELERVEVALAMGCWQSAVYFGTGDARATRRLAALLTGLFSGVDSRPDPIRAHFCTRGSAVNASDFHTDLTSPELALLLQLPREEAPSYAIHDMVDFDVDFQPSLNMLEIGKIQWQAADSGNMYGVEVEDLARHGVVFGVTGSGKTTTVLGLLYRLWKRSRPVPFLVIEPAKTEYRSLLGRILKGRPWGPIPELRVYTLGKDTVAPFRLNPFEFDLGSSPGEAPVLSHIDFLKAVFNAAFILYAPMPYVLETALHEIYIDKGWDLTTGRNVRLPNEEWVQRHRFPIFPTLTDLYHKIEEVTARLGYDRRIEQDVIAGLKARIGALRLGAKGMMLDVPRGIPLEALLSQPTVLELENIGNDDEKTFLIGLLLARLYGYRRLQAAEGALTNTLQHLLIVEEAHRLLQNVGTNVDTESSNLRAQAIETFVNMLSEVRHYGQGVLIAEQIPTKLTPDAIKNSNLKIIHRLLARDDRELLAQTMNMTEAQATYLTTLRAGDAVVYAEGDDHPYLLAIENFKQQHKVSFPTEKEVRELAEHYIELQQHLTVPDLLKHGVRATHLNGPDATVYQTVLYYLSQSPSSRIWSRIIARTVWHRSALVEAVDQLRQQIASEPRHLVLPQYEEALTVLIVLGASQALQARGAARGWSYGQVEELRLYLTSGLLHVARTGELRLAASDLDRFARAYETNMRRRWGPYPGCHACRSICSYHAEVASLLSPIDLGSIQSIFSKRTFKSRDEQYHGLAQQLEQSVKQWLGGEAVEVQEMAYCTALTSAPRLGLDEYEQREFGGAIHKQLLK